MATRNKKQPAQELQQAAPAAPEQQETTITAYKGFNADWTCRGFQYEVGKSYEHEGPVAACESGFHACEHPLHVLRYYRPASSVYAVVQQGGTLARHEEDSKIASSKLSITAQIDLAGIVKAAIKYTIDRCTPAAGAHTDRPNTAVAAAEAHMSASANGDSSASSANGYSSASSANGYSSASSANGDYSASSANGDSSASSANGYSSASSANGYSSASSANGDYSASSANGDYSASSANGDYSASSANGEHCVAMSAGRFGKARGKDGCALFLVHRNSSGQITHAKALLVGQDDIKADTFYTLDASGNAMETR